MTRQPKVIKRYSISFKQKVVKEIEEEGLGITEAASDTEYGGGNTVQNWLKRFGKNYLLSKLVRMI